MPKKQEIKIDASLYEECKPLFEPLFITVETAIEIFLAHATMEKGFPFTVYPHEILECQSPELLDKYAYKIGNRVLNKLFPSGNDEQIKK